MPSILALAGSFGLLLALDAGLFVMLTLTNFLNHTTAGALTLEALQSTLQGFILTDAYLGHCYPSPRSYRLAANGAIRTHSGHIHIIAPFHVRVNHEFGFPGGKLRKSDAKL